MRQTRQPNLYAELGLVKNGSDYLPRYKSPGWTASERPIFSPPLLTRSLTHTLFTHDSLLDVFFGIGRVWWNV